MAEISADDLVFYTDGDKGVYSGGYSIDSILMKSGISPIMTVRRGGGGAANADASATDVATSLFGDLVVPNWALTVPAKGGGSDKYTVATVATSIFDDDATDPETLYEKLLALASDHPVRTRAHSPVKTDPEPEPEPEAAPTPAHAQEPKRRKRHPPITHKHKRKPAPTLEQPAAKKTRKRHKLKRISP